MYNKLKYMSQLITSDENWGKEFSFGSFKLLAYTSNEPWILSSYRKVIKLKCIWRSGWHFKATKSGHLPQLHYSIKLIKYSCVHRPNWNESYHLPLTITTVCVRLVVTWPDNTKLLLVGVYCYSEWAFPWCYEGFWI